MPDDVFNRACEEFSEAELVALTFVAVATNAWNRIVVSFRVPAGSYKPQTAHA